MRRIAPLLAVSCLVAVSLGNAQEGERPRAAARAVDAGAGAGPLERPREGGPGARSGTLDAPTVRVDVVQVDPSAAHPGSGPVVVLERLGLGRGFFGVRLVGLTDQLRARFGVPPGEGTLVSEVVVGSPAHAAGVRAGDTITEIDAQRVRRTGDVGRLVASREGERVELEVVRAGAPTTMMVTVGERERPLVKVGRVGDRVVLQWIRGPAATADDVGAGRFLLDDALDGLALYFESDEWRERAEGSAAELDAVQLERRIQTIRRQLEELRRRVDRAEPR